MRCNKEAVSTINEAWGTVLRYGVVRYTLSVRTCCHPGRGRPPHTVPGHLLLPPGVHLPVLHSQSKPKAWHLL
jgi:hypothetical protein